MRCFACLLTASLAAQDPAAVNVQFTADAEGKGPPALVWLRQDFLPGLQGWPRELDSRSAFVLRLSASGISARQGTASVPDGAYLAGEFRVPGIGSVLLSCDPDGVEDWFVPDGADLPPRLRQLLADLGADEKGLRTIDIAALAGHLGRVMEGDPESPLLGLGAAWCGELTWTAFADDQRTRVRGRSGGGLLLPCAIVWWATLPLPRDQATWWTASGPLPERWSLRAFAARDGDRAEATRQLSRAGLGGPAVLTALLHADDQSRIAAMDGLVRQQNAAALPRIVAAANPKLPATVAMAEHALTELWPMAQPETRSEVQRLLANHPAEPLRQFAAKLARPPDPAPAGATSSVVRTIAWFTIIQCLVFGLWLRERRLLQMPGHPRRA